jgi:DNA helicase II / ATP-dependent DNA helicase PcrA
MTRAMDRVYLTFASRRMLFGSVQPRQRSRFINEMPSVQVIGTQADPALRQQRPAPGRWAEVAVHANAGAGVGLNLMPGDRVRHASWGDGVVVDAKAGGGDGLLTIDFPSVGRKMVMLKYAPLEKV